MCDASKLDAALSTLSDAAELFPEFCERLIYILDTGQELVSLKCYGATTTLATEVCVVLYPSDILLRLMTAARAGDADLCVFEHATSPDGDSNATTTVEDTQ
ncbi:hypothetical protein B5K06_25995 [Rhizobium grahamii]|uniref:Uncharacterized protein n=1 Tax=Rhizobium grahamii TaxID=1120045 RepID=A0A370KJ71_9HYPH|nr:hypothetical protein B5K06_25995 [Rhizobium grahamii]